MSITPLMPVYPRSGVRPVRGEHCHLISEDGTRYLDFASGPFYGFNRQGSTPIPGVIQNWWRQAMMGGAKAQYDGIKAFSETDFTDDLASITVPTFIPENR